MFFPELITGSILILSGFLVKIFPNLIAGYNSLSEAQKKRVDIDGLSSYMRKNLVVLGILVIAIGFVLYQIEFKEMYVLMITSAIIIIDVIYLTIQSGKFYNKR